VGFGCTTCIGNSGPLPDAVTQAVQKESLVVAAVLSGNRNFEGRINPLIKANYLASPPLVVAYALAGTMDIDLTSDPLGEGSDGQPVFLRDIWPSNEEVASTVRSAINRGMFEHEYAHVFDGDKNWQSLAIPTGGIYQWDDASTYIKETALLRQHGGPWRAPSGFPRAACAGAARRFRHHRPHLPGRVHPQGRPRRKISHGARRAAGRFQLLRREPRQSRGHGPRYAGQHPPAQSTGARHRGRRDAPPAGWRADVYLRRVQIGRASCRER